jgi:hypothetical protein
MVEKFFWSLCAALILSAMGLIALGSFTNQVAVIYGFIAFALTFMGMMMILPHSVSHPDARKVETKTTPATEPIKPGRARAGALRSA